MAFRAFFALPAENFQTSTGEPVNAVYGFASMIATLVADRKPTHMAVAFDLPGGTFRTERYPAYKGTRGETPPEFIPQVPLLRDLLAALRIPAIDKDNYEADDILATYARQGAERGFEVFVVSGDRDTLQLVNDSVTVLYPRKGVSDLVVMTPDAVREKYGVAPDRYPDLAALVGETSDNLPGVPGVGPKTAAKWVEAYGGLDQILAAAEDIPGKVGESLRANLDQVALNREINHLLTDLDLPLTIDDLVRTGGDAAAIHALCDALQFKGLRPRLLALAADGSDGPDGEARAAPAAEAPDRRHRGRGRRRGVPRRPRRDRRDRRAGPGRAWGGNGRRRGMGRRSRLARRPRRMRRSPRGWAPRMSPRSATAPRRRGTASPPGATTSRGSRATPRSRRTSCSPTSAASTWSPWRSATSGSSRWRRPAASWISGSARPRRRRRLETPALVSRLAGEAGRGARGARHGRALPRPRASPHRSAGENGGGGRRRRRGHLGTLAGECGKRAEAAQREAWAAIDGFEVNLGSPKQLQEVLFDRLGMPKTKKIKTGYTTDAAALADLYEKRPHPFLEALLAYRAASKLGQIIETLASAIGADGRIHTTFSQVVASTGRLSSLDPNLQNIPIRTDDGHRIREAFTVGEGFETLLTADYSQIEMRIMAHLSGDAELIEAFKAGEDLHRFVGARVFGVQPENVTPEMRSKVKAMSYGLAYGLSSFGLARQLGTSTGEAQSLMDDYFSRFGAVRDYLASVVAEARSTGYTATIFGRRRYLPDLNSTDRQRRDMAERMALNAPIQGSAADLIKRAMLGVAARFDAEGLASRQILQVHDELVIEVAPGERAAAEAIVREEMAGAADLSVPLDVHVGVGANWRVAGH